MSLKKISLAAIFICSIAQAGWQDTLALAFSDTYCNYAKYPFIAAFVMGFCKKDPIDATFIIGTPALVCLTLNDFQDTMRATGELYKGKPTQKNFFIGSALKTTAMASVVGYVTGFGLRVAAEMVYKSYNQSAEQSDDEDIDADENAAHGSCPSSLIGE